MSKWLAVGIGLVVAGCGAPAQGVLAKNPSQRDEAVVERWADSCLRSDAGPVYVRYAPAPGGGAVSFTTPGDEAKLRDRVRSLARMHSGQVQRPDEHSLVDLPHYSYYDEISEGAKVTFVAEANNDLDTLRRHLQQDVLSMHRKGCLAAHEVL